MAVFEKQLKISGTRTRKRDIPSGLWLKCNDCGEMIFSKELTAKLKVCPKCDYHFAMTAPERITLLADDGAFREIDADLVSVDTLNFKGVAAYKDRLKAYQRQTGLNDAVVTGLCQLNGHDVSRPAATPPACRAVVA